MADPRSAVLCWKFASLVKVALPPDLLRLGATKSRISLQDRFEAFIHMCAEKFGAFLGEMHGFNEQTCIPFTGKLRRGVDDHAPVSAATRFSISL
jgi:hypothetical protein